MRERIPVDHQQRLRWPLRHLRRARARAAGLAALAARRPAPRFRQVAQHRPGGCMVACAFLATDLAIHPGADKTLGAFRAQKQMIDAQPGIARPAISHVVPERVHGRIGMQGADGVGPSLVENTPERSTTFRLNQRIPRIRFGRIDVAVGRNDVVIAGQHDRRSGAIELRRMRRETFHPGKLVREFWAGLRVAVGRVQRGHQHAIHCRLQVAALAVSGISRQLGLRDDGLATAGEDGNAVP